MVDDAGTDSGSISGGWALNITTQVPVCCDSACTINAADITVPSNNSDGECGAFVFYGQPSLTGSCGVVTGNPPSGSFFPVGTTPVTMTATKQNMTVADTDTINVTVTDAQAPQVGARVASTRSVLTVANFNLVNVGLKGFVADECHGPLMTEVLVYSDEDDQAPNGDATLHSPDAKNFALELLRVRAERNPGADGRVYLIVVKVTDTTSGNIGYGVTTVVVPLSSSVADRDAALAQAAAAQSFFNSNPGTTPPGYFVVGDGPVVGPFQ